MRVQEGGDVAARAARPGRTARVAWPLVGALLLAAGSAGAQTVITQIIDSTGTAASGSPANVPLGQALDVEVDADGNVFVSSVEGSRVFRIDGQDGSISLVLDSQGDDPADPLDDLSGPDDIELDEDGNLYVVGSGSHNVYKVTPAGVKTEILTAAGDEMGASLAQPTGLAVGSGSNPMVYVVGRTSDNIFAIDQSSVQPVSELLEGSDPDLVTPFSGPAAIAIDASGILYLSACSSDNVFRIDPNAANVAMDAKVILPPAGTGVVDEELLCPLYLDVESDGSAVYVPGSASNNVFQILDPGGTPTPSLMIDSTGDGTTPLLGPVDVVVVNGEGVLVASSLSDAVFWARPSGSLTVVADASGDGLNALDEPVGLALSSPPGPNLEIDFLVTGFRSSNAFEVVPEASAALAQATALLALLAAARWGRRRGA